MWITNFISCGNKMIFESAPESVKKTITRSGGRKCLFFVLSQRNGTVQIISFGGEIH